MEVLVYVLVVKSKSSTRTIKIRAGLCVDWLEQKHQFIIAIKKKNVGDELKKFDTPLCRITWELV